MNLPISQANAEEGTVGSEITIVGGLPEPVGGVTNFVFRFSVHFKSRIKTVIDLYPSMTKWEVAGVQRFIRPRSKCASMFWLLHRILSCDSGILYFNFSSPRSFFLLFFLPKRKGVKWALTLHHGELSNSIEKSSFFLRLVTRKALIRIERVGHIGGKQREFYKEFGVDENRLYSVVTYLPYVDGGPTNDGVQHAAVRQRLEGLRGRVSKLVVASGYPTSIYRHDWVLRYFEEFSGDAGLVMCLYGADSDGLLEDYKTWAATLPNVMVVETLSPHQFQELLRRADIYVRPTLTDSYGVAVAEALACGLIVIASDACERAPGAHLFERNDRASFESLLDKALQGDLHQQESQANNSLALLEDFLALT